jgi:plastocyanin
MRAPRRLAVLMGALLVGALWGPASASAATSPFLVTADRPGAVPSGHNWSFNDFFPRTFSVHRDRVLAISIQGFHTATLLPKGMTVAQDRNLHRTEKLDSDDTTRNPNGTRKANFETAPLLPTSFSCGASSNPCPFDGHSIVSSGLPMGPGAFYVKVTAPVGTYQFLCRVHSGMSGSLTVVGAAAHATTDSERRAKVVAQIRADRHEAFAAEAAANKAAVRRNANGTRTWLLTAGTGTAHAAVLEMLPRSINIRKGDTVAWRSPEINEPHTVTFPDEQFTDFIPKCEEAAGVDSNAIPLHFPPTSPFDFGCGGPPPTRPADEIELGGGNGVRHIANTSTISDSGILQSQAMDIASHLPFDAARAQWSVRFTNAVPGTYHYICQVHFGMQGTIVVH